MENILSQAKFREVGASSVVTMSSKMQTTLNVNGGDTV
jgi:hypothetical protein